MFVLGTAGHVDHGKSSLIHALTGQAPDRLAVEKARGMTIDLNFVFLDSPPFGRVGIVDVPGHRRFVKNMVTGAAAVDAFLFVVAADDGWMPQSEEHLNILAALGVTQGIVVLTKVDLVDSAHLREVRAEVEARFVKAGIRPTAVVDFSKTDRQTVQSLRDRIAEMLPQLPLRSRFRSARLWVDRSFIPRGVGLVATGTLSEGRLSVGDGLYAWPTQEQLTIKSLQAYGTEVANATASSRVAVGLGSVGTNIGRGVLLTSSPAQLTSFVEARLSFWEKIPRRNFKVAMHVGTTKILATLIEVGEGAYRIKLPKPFPLRSGERLLLRASGAERSLGGGVVTDPNPRAVSKAQAAINIASYQPGEAQWQAYLFSKCALGERIEFTNSIFSDANTEQKLCDNNVFHQIGSQHVLRQTDWEKVKTTLHSILHTSFAKTNEPFTQKKIETLILKVFDAELNVDKSAVAPLIAEVVKSGLGVLWSKAEGGFLPFGVELKISSEEALIRREVLSFFSVGSAPVSLRDWSADIPGRRELVKKMAREGQIVGFGEGFYLSAEGYKAFKNKIYNFLINAQKATTPQLKDCLSLSRRDAVLILEKLDGVGFTKFSENHRSLTPLAKTML